jgi:hypothetical protein
MVIARDGAQWVATQRYTQQDKPPVLCIGLGSTMAEATTHCVELFVARIMGAAHRGN